jgi:hypothetical protein
MNREGVTLVSTVPRQKFFHLVLVDIPPKPNVTSLPEGAESNARVLHGKPATPSKFGVRGLNDYTDVTATNDAMKGKYFGYDGPCPPCGGVDAMKGKVLAEGEELGLYTQTPAKGAVVQK